MSNPWLDIPEADYVGHMSDPAVGLDLHARRTEPPPRRELRATPPPGIRAALRKHPLALRTFEALAPSHRRRYLAWIESAKRPDTRARRLQEAIALFMAGKPLGLK